MVNLPDPSATAWSYVHGQTGSVLSGPLDASCSWYQASHIPIGSDVGMLYQPNGIAVVHIPRALSGDPSSDAMLTLMAPTFQSHPDAAAVEAALIGSGSKSSTTGGVVDITPGVLLNLFGVVDSVWNPTVRVGFMVDVGVGALGKSRRPSFGSGLEGALDLMGSLPALSTVPELPHLCSAVVNVKLPLFGTPKAI